MNNQDEQRQKNQTREIRRNENQIDHDDNPNGSRAFGRSRKSAISISFGSGGETCPWSINLAINGGKIPNRKQLIEDLRKFRDEMANQLNQLDNLIDELEK
ncbi:MAG: hypothetical protein KME17_08130 [Cyanosarcina radialis HA8281-LM2]|jgi:hypothetical protein|nr:hypothetical protein [Cyanosarcina radialis HA8281-LM2]